MAMAFGKYLSSLTKPELEDYKEQLNLTDDELEIFNFLCRGKNTTEISLKLNISSATVDRKIKTIKTKFERIKNYVEIRKRQNSDLGKTYVDS